MNKPYQASIDRAAYLLNRRHYLTAGLLINRIGPLAEVCEDGWYLSPLWDLDDFVCTYHRDNKEQIILALAGWIDRLPINVPVIAEISRHSAMVRVTACRYAGKELTQTILNAERTIFVDRKEAIEVIP